MFRRNALSLMAIGSGSFPFSFHRLGTSTAGADLRERIIDPTGEVDWVGLRKEFLLGPKLVFLNSGSVGCSPDFLLKHVDQVARKIESHPQRHVWLDGVVQEIETLRQQVARMFSANADELTFTENTTSALASVVSGIDWRAGDEIIVSNHEHLSCEAVWQYAAKRFGLKIRYARIEANEFNSDEFLSRLETQITPQTRACCLSHVDSFSGIALPIKQAAQLLQRRGVIVVCDAAQSLGLMPVSCHELGVDALCGSGHKWLLGPKGTGLLYISQAAQETIRPFQTSWSFGASTPATGTRNLAGLAGWSAVMELQDVVKIERAAAHNIALSRLLAERLLDRCGLKPLIKQSPENETGMIAFSFPSTLDSSKVAQRLATEHNIIVKPLPSTCELEPDAAFKVNHNAIRVSLHVYNSEQDVERLVETLTQMMPE